MTQNKKSVAEILSGLSQFTGSEEYFKHWTGRLIFTEGVRYLAESCGAYLLIDIVARDPHKPKVRACGGFQLWEIKLTPGNKHMAVVTCSADSNTKPVVTQRIEYTDFTLPDGIKLYVRDSVLMLPSEN